VVRRLVRIWVERGDADRHAAQIVSRFVAYLIVTAGLLYALNQLDVDLVPILGALGVAGIALAFAFQNILENFIAGILILMRRPIRIGEQVSLSGTEGTVTDIDLRTVVVRRVDGKLVFVPNAAVLSNPIVNLTREGIRRTTLDVGVAYHTDLDRAREVILQAVGSVEGVLADPPPEAYVHTFGSSSIDVAVRYWHHPTIAVEWEVRDLVARDLKRHFDRSGIEIPFPQRVLWAPEGLRVQSGGEPVEMD
jgi:small-conductance mechanosensitive channel